MMVVGIHTFAVEEVDMSRAVDVNALARQMLNCAVPIFLAISGFFLCQKTLDTLDEKKAFWKKQIPKVYIPALIVSVPYLALDLYRGESPVVSLVWLLICGYSIYYFVALILQYYALLPMLQRVSRGGVILLGAISLVSVGLYTWLIYYKGVNLPLIAYAGPFPMWCVFFGLGCYLRKTERRYSLAVPGVFVMVGIVLQYEECHWLSSLGEGGGFGFGIKMSAWVYSIAVIMLVFSVKVESCYKQNVITSSIEYLGSISFTIYLYHLFVLMVLSRLHLGVLPWIGRWTAAMLVTAACAEVARRVLPKKVRWLAGLSND